MNDKQALQLLSDLWQDIDSPDFLWQALALLACLAAAWGLARWWIRRRPVRGKLQAAGNRLAFPLIGLVLVAAVRLALKPFIHVNLLKVAMPLLGAMALVRGIVYVLRQAFPAKVWLATWERIIAFVIWAWLALVITDTAPYVIEAMEQVSFRIGKQDINLWMVLHGLVTVFLTVVFALWIAGLVERRLMGMDEMDSSLRIVFVRVAKALLTVFAIMLSLSLVGIDMTALSVFTGALGVGLGFGLQKIASNYVSGFIILLDRSIKIGNVVNVDAGTGGIVSQITTRFTVLRNSMGVEFIVPNETLVSTIVQNHSYSDTRVRVATMVGVAYGTDLDKAMALMIEAARQHPRVLADPAPGVQLTLFADSAINLELGFWIADPQNGVGNVRSDVNLAIWQAFKANGVSIPYPQREVRVLSGSAGGQDVPPVG